MFLLLKIFTLATAVVVTVGLLVVGPDESSDPPAPEKNTLVSAHPSGDDTTSKPYGAPAFTTPQIDVNTPHTAPSDGTTVASSVSPVAATVRNHLTNVGIAYVRPSDQAAGQPLDATNPAAARDHASGANISSVFLTDDHSAAETVPPPNFTVAFMGDQGPDSEALAVLALIKSEGAEMVLHQGDFDYNDDPDAWDQRITDVLGPNFPYFASIGNHDKALWLVYQQKLVERLARIPEARCSGDLGVKSSCSYRGVFFILSGVGVLGTGHEDFLREELDQTDAIWRICSWHKNQRDMQIGGKSDGTGWGVYEVCREGGAIIATAHEHSYERTKSLIDIQKQVVDPEWPHPRELRVAPGVSFVFVSGLGGKSIREQTRCLPSTPPYGCNGEWASIYSSTQGAGHGALFCSFNFAAQPDKARCYFKDIGGVVPDEFTITNFVAQAPQ